ncbi:MAG: hypothetical protein ACOCZS_03290 [Verrucomicrobiota bacterium]
MEHKIIHYHIDDIAIDPEDICDSLNEACTKRQHRFRLRGICQLENHVYFVMVPLRSGEPREEYIITTLEDISHEGFIATVNNRYQGGFDVIGSFQVYETHMALFAKVLQD